jgi:hypothetical protein
VPTVQSIPTRTSVQPTIEGELRHSIVMDTSSEVELVKLPCTGVQTPADADYTPVAPIATQSSFSGGSDIRGQETGSPLRERECCWRWFGAQGPRLSPPRSQISVSTNRAFL